MNRLKGCTGAAGKSILALIAMCAVLSAGEADAAELPDAVPARDESPAPPGQVIVDEEAAERALERSLVEFGGLLLRPGRIEIEPSLRYARREDVFPGIVTRDGETFLGQREHHVDDLTAGIAVRLGLPFDSQLEVELPYHWRRVESVDTVAASPFGATTASGSGPGNLRVGLARTLFREEGWRPDLIGRLSWDTRSGRAGDGGIPLASDFHAVQGSLIAIKRQDPLVFAGGLAYEHVFERRGVQPGAAIAPSLGAFVALSPETSIRLVASQTFREKTRVDGERIAGTREQAATLTIGASSLVARGVLLDVSLGIGLTTDAEDYSLRIALPIRLDKRLF